jgi:hypothetical protein
MFSGIPRLKLVFKFEFYWHDAGEQVVMGLTIPGGRGFEDGVDLLHYLAGHPSTARHVATKLVRHFVADDPPAALVDELTRVFLATDGDLRAVTLALFTSEAFYAPEHYRAKVKRPYEFVVSALRLADAQLGRASTLFLAKELTSMRHRPYTEPAPTGFPATSDEWVSEGAMLQRMNFALGLGQDFANRRSNYQTVFDLIVMPDAELHIDPFTLVRIDERPDNVSTQVLTRRVLDRLFAGTVQPELERLIAEDLARLPQPTARETLIRRALALAIGSPEFQRY